MIRYAIPVLSPTQGGQIPRNILLELSLYETLIIISKKEKMATVWDTSLYFNYIIYYIINYVINYIINS
jgi:hypothetical protein